MSDEEIGVRVRLKERRRFSAEAKKAAHDVDEIGDAARRADRKIMGLNARITFLQNSVQFLRFPAMIAGVGLAASGVSALTAGVVALTSALVPASGVIATMPQGLSAWAQGISVVTMATHGLSDAVGGLTDDLDPEAMAKLTPQAQKLAVSLFELKAPMIAIRNEAQKGLFPGLEEAIDHIMPALYNLAPIARETGRVIGGLAAQAGHMFASREWQHDIASLGHSNAIVISDMGHTVLALANALRNLMVAAEPLTEWLSHTALQWAVQLEEYTAVNRANGGLADQFERVRWTLEQLFDILGNTYKALRAVGHAAYPLGAEILVELNKQLADLTDWLESAEGQGTLTAYFADAKPAIWEMGRLVRDLSKAFFSLANHTDLAPLMKQVREDLLPALVTLLDTTTSAFGPALVDALVNVTDLLATLSTETGPLTLYVTALSELAEALNWLFTTVPGTKEVASSLLILGASVKLLRILDLVSGFRALRGLLSAEGTLAKGLMWFSRTTAGTAIGVWALEAATWAANTALWGMAAALLANPITWIVVGVLALAAGFAILYWKVEWFRNAVNDTISWVIDHWKILVAAIPLIGPPLFVVIQLWDQIKSVGVGAFDAVRSAVRWVINAVQDLIGFIGDLIDKIESVPGVKQALDAGKWGANAAGDVFGAAQDVAGFLGLPHLATGGIVTSGSFVVGEQGMEVGTILPGGGVRIDPLPDVRSRSSSAVPDPSPTPEAHGDFRSPRAPIHIHLNVDGHEMATVVHDYAEDDDARG